MILMETAAKVRRLVLRDGHSIRSVSRTTGLSRNTIKKYLKDSSSPHYHRDHDPVRHVLVVYEERLRLYYEQDLKLILPLPWEHPSSHRARKFVSITQ